jgi:hypothetical protein
VLHLRIAAVFTYVSISSRTPQSRRSGAGVFVVRSLGGTGPEVEERAP